MPLSRALPSVLLPALALALAATAAASKAAPADGDKEPALGGTPDCADGNFQCSYWAAIGECDKNPKYMHVVCTLACRLCPGDNNERSSQRYRQLELSFATAPAVEPPAAGVREVSFDPRVFVFDDFLTEEEVETLKELTTGHLTQSRTINRTTGLEMPDKVRTNKQAYLSNEDCHSHPVVAPLIQRLYRLARIPHGHGEALQVGRYLAGEFYEPHFDSEPAQHVLRSATVLLYLSAPEDGGETIFPKRHQCQGETFHECCTDIEGTVATLGGGTWLPVKSRQAVLFYSHDLDGNHNPFGLHGSCPVRAGEKWIAQQWFRTEAYPGSPHFERPFRQF